MVRGVDGVKDEIAWGGVEDFVIKWFVVVHGGFVLMRRGGERRRRVEKEKGRRGKE